jgi:hypothetical protein
MPWSANGPLKASISAMRMGSAAQMWPEVRTHKASSMARIISHSPAGS